MLAAILLSAAVCSGVCHAQAGGAWESAAPEDKALHLRGKELTAVYTRHEGRIIKSDRDWVWVGSADGYVFYTSDGEKWQESKIDKATRITDLYFDDEAGFLLAGTTLYRSDDEGARWRPIRTFPFRQSAAPVLYRMAFAGKKKACIVGVYAKKKGTSQDPVESLIICTDNGGETWGSREVKGKEELLHVTFFDEQNGWAVGVRSVVYRTRDGGLKWERMLCPGAASPTPKPCPPSSPSLFYVHFVSPQRGWAVGEGASIFYTNDGGDSWQRRPTPASVPKLTNLLSIKFIDPDHGWIVGSNGTILYTEDGGVNWIPQLSGPTRTLRALSLGGNDKRQAWIVGSAGTVLKFVPR